jgi:FAD/FMN-containing dehydrogenase
MTHDHNDAVIAKELSAALRGEVITAEHADYDRARRVWNGAIDRRPAVIARCADTADVVACVGVARRQGIEVAIRGGGHQIAGSGVCDDGLVIDLSAMNGVHVDPDSRTAQVAAGARWADVDRATQLFGLATTGGEVSITGVAGLTLGGGMGLLQRAFGLACDNLRSVEVVTADGVVRTASSEEHTDLFWAARGAGRGLGVVTSFEFNLRPLGPEVAAAWVVYPDDDARSVVRAWRELALAAPRTVSPELLLWGVPPDPEIPAQLHGQAVVMAMGLFAGDAAASGDALAPFAELGTPLLDLGGTMPYADLQSSADELFAEGNRYFFKSHFADELGDDAIDALVTSFERRPNAESLVAVRTLGGAIDDVGYDDSAYPHRGRRFNVSFDAAWVDANDDARLVKWARDSWTAYRPFAAGGVYVNFAGFDDEADVTPDDTLGATARRAEVRKAYDPDGVFAAAAQRP